MNQFMRYSNVVIHSPRYLRLAVCRSGVLTMKEVQILIDNAVSSAKASRSDLKKAHKCIQNVGAIGSKIGFLYALCCTPTRERLYQSIFKELMVVNGNMGSMIYRSDA